MLVGFPFQCQTCLKANRRGYIKLVSALLFQSRLGFEYDPRLRLAAAKFIKTSRLLRRLQPLSIRSEEGYVLMCADDAYLQ